MKRRKMLTFAVKLVDERLPRHITAPHVVAAYNKAKERFGAEQVAHVWHPPGLDGDWQ